MFTPQRRIESSVVERLHQQAYRFDFFQAVRMLEKHYLNLGAQTLIVGGHIRFRNSLNLGFPPSEIELLEFSSAVDFSASPSTVTLKHNDLPHYEITPSFMGLTGLVGALPRHYTEKLIERESLHRDRTARAFLDVFSNRMVALFYQSWKKYRLPVQYEQDRRNLFTPLLLSLTGCDQIRLRSTLQAGGKHIFDESIAHYAGIVRHRPASAQSVQRLLSDYFGVSIRIKQFIGRWFAIPAAQRTTLSGAFSELGVSSFCGERIWQRQTCMQLLVGPMTRKEFLSFLPYGEAAKALSRLLALTLGETFEFEVRLLLKKEEIFSASFGNPEKPARLGWDTFLRSTPAEQDSDDAQYAVEANAA